MGRMFRIISERGTPVATEVDKASGDDAVALLDEDVPFIEVGGPEGVVTSISPPAPRVATIPAVAVATPTPVEEPSLVETPPPVPGHFLSVTFHRLPKVGLRLVPNGVTADLVAYHFPDHAVSHEYAAVRSELRRQFEESGSRALGFTAGLPESGATTVLLNLAASFAGEPVAKVLVVDANFARPAAAVRLGVADRPGLAEVLTQATPLAWAVQPTPVANLHVVAAGRDGEDTAEAMAADFPRLVGQLRQWFDWVFVDVGVWTDASGRGVVGPACDAVYLVSRQADIERPEFIDLRAAVSAAGGVPRGYITTRE